VPALILALPLPVKSLVFISGAVNPYESIKKVFVERKAFNPASISTLPRSDGKFTSVSPEFWKDLKRHENLPSLLKSHTGSILALHGTEDTEIPVKGIKELYKKARGEKKLKIFKDGDHGILDVPKAMRQEFLQDIVNWFKKTL